MKPIPLFNFIAEYEAKFPVYAILVALLWDRETFSLESWRNYIKNLISGTSLKWRVHTGQLQQLLFIFVVTLTGAWFCASSLRNGKLLLDYTWQDGKLDIAIRRALNIKLSASTFFNFEKLVSSVNGYRLRTEVRIYWNMSLSYMIIYLRMKLKDKYMVIKAWYLCMTFRNWCFHRRRQDKYDWTWLRTDVIYKSNISKNRKAEHKNVCHKSGQRSSKWRTRNRNW